MGTFSIWHWLILLAVVLVLFGGSGKISNLMGDVAKGIKSFKKGLAEDDSDVAETAKTIEQDVDRATKVDANSKSEAKS